MPHAFDYSIVRVVPRVEREEFINVGAIVFCPNADYLGAAIDLDERRLLALFPDVDVALVRSHLDAVVLVCRGGGASGPIGALAPRERFLWLTSPKNTIVQTSAPHAGLTDDPAHLLQHLLDTVVRLKPTRSRP